MINTTHHHPDESMLIEFSAGTLDTAASICVSAHLHFCSSCREKLLRLDQVGSQLMSQAEPVEVADDALARVMEKIDSGECAAPEENNFDGDLPFSVNKLLDTSLINKNWKRLSSSVDVARFKTGQDNFEVALHKICAGGKTPKHDHKGLEYTVVLKGSFSDENAVYREGDFILRQPGDVHQPMGAQNGECICLSALSAPIAPTSPLGFLMKPWLRINPM
ncbi:MAG: ChrR family anti-sigma-E factor [Porticoccaceae bacterium]